MPLSSELREALARGRRRPRPSSRSDGRVDTDHQDNGNLRAADPATDHHDAMPADDPDDDDSAPRLSLTLKESSLDGICALPAAQAEQITGRSPIPWINQKRSNRLLKQQQGRQRFLHRPICSIPRCSVRCRQRSPPL
jgi:hypothetical protein